jgi:DNA-binding NtrC family response regulator
MSESILIVDQDIQSSFHLSRQVAKAGYQALCAQDLGEGMQRLGDPSVKVMLLDDATRLTQRAALPGIRQLRPDVDVVLMVPKGRISSVVEAMRLGAQDCLCKPVEEPQLMLTVENCLRNQKLEDQIEALRVELGSKSGLDGIIGSSHGLQRALGLLRRVAAFPVSVLIQGESGTGKDLFAQAIHACSGRRDFPFVAVDCSAFPAELMESELFGYVRGAFTGAEESKPGRLELADKGTLFIDEVGNLPASVQVKLLRVLQERRICRIGSGEAVPVDLRLVAASNVNLRGLISEGRFREDLYHRINEFGIELPPLRERGEDVELLARFFLHRYNQDFSKSVLGFSDAALARLRAYPWPGNIRQLQNAVKRAVVLSQERVEEEALPAEILGWAPERQGEEFQAAQDPGPEFEMPEGILPLWDARAQVSAQLERHCIEQALLSHRWNRSTAAEALGIHLKTLCRKIREQGIA